jgi:hypothetical protein
MESARPTIQIIIRPNYIVLLKYCTQVASETAEIIQSDVLHGSRVVLDVEEEGLGERTILSLDAAHKISSDGTTCFRSSDGKEHCFVDAQPGECGEHVHRRNLVTHRRFRKVVTSPPPAPVVNVVNTATNTVNTAVAIVTNNVDAACDAIASNSASNFVSSVSNAASDAATKAVNTAKNTVNTIKIVPLGPVYRGYADKTKTAMRQLSVTGQLPTCGALLDGLEAGAVLAAKRLEEGAYVVAEGGVLIAQWVQANYCEIGISLALGIIFGALLYRPEPASQATTTAATAPLTSTAILWLTAKDLVAATALGIACDLVAEAFVGLIWMSPDVRNAIGAANKDLLIDGIAFTLFKSIDVAAGSMIVPQSCAAVVAGVVITLTAQLACQRTLPSGAREWGTTGASGF